MAALRSGAPAARDALPPVVDNFSYNQRLWDVYSDNWKRSEVYLRFDPGEDPNAYRDERIRLLGEEWGPPEDVDTVVGTFIRPYLDASSIAAEIGVGGGRIATRVAPQVGEFWCLDVSKEMLARTRKALHGERHVHYVLLTEPKFPDGLEDHFDFVYSFDVFVHLDLHVMWKYFQEIRRILRPGGTSFVHTSNLTAPGGWAHFARQDRFSVGEHYFISPEIARLLAARAGLRVVQEGVPATDNFYLNRDFLFVVRKPEKVDGLEPSVI
jgi:SAM-dependent methyltransferase